MNVHANQIFNDEYSLIGSLFFDRNQFSANFLFGWLLPFQMLCYLSINLFLQRRSLGFRLIIAICMQHWRTHTHTQCHRGNWLKLLITWTQTKCTKWTVNSIWYLITTVNWNLPWTASTVTIKLPPIMIAIATKTTNLIIATVFFHCQFQIGIYLFYGVFLLLW